MRIGGGGLRARRDGGGRRLGEEEWAVLQERSPSLAISYLDLTMCILGGCVCSRLKRVERKEPWAGWGKTLELTTILEEKPFPFFPTWRRMEN